MLLILAITVFAGVAVGVVTLLRTRHESYPYQVQSYQAYALAHAGVEFAMRYADDNADDFFVNPAAYLPPGKEFSYGNGKFSLTYRQGTYTQGKWDCRDILTSRGTCGTATRAVELLNFSFFVGQQNNSVYVTRIQKYCYGPTSGCTFNTTSPYSGDRIEIDFCDPSLFLPGANESRVVRDSVTIAATTDGSGQQVKLLRFGFSGSGEVGYNWVWDAACTAVPAVGQTLPNWDPVAYPVPRAIDSFHAPDAAWNVNNPWLYGSSDPNLDAKCRPQLPSDPYTDPYYPRPNPYPRVPLDSPPYPYPYPSFDNDRTTCMVAGAYVARSHATCYATNPMPVNPPYKDNDQWTCPPNCPPPTVVPTGGANEGAALYSGKQLRFAIETSGRIVVPVTLFISFKHRPGGPSGFGPENLNVFKFTVQ